MKAKLRQHPDLDSNLQMVLSHGNKTERNAITFAVNSVYEAMQSRLLRKAATKSRAKGLAAKTK